MVKHLPPQLRHLVSQTVSLLGEVIRAELGTSAFQRIEALRQEMAELRGSSSSEAHRVLRRRLRALGKLSRQERFEIAHAFSLMLELMNTCENAYRSFLLSQRPEYHRKASPEAIVYVLTAHPTEARSTKNIIEFQKIQSLLIASLKGGSLTHQEADLKHALRLAWKIPICRNRKPRVEDEAEHIYSLVLKKEVLETLIKAYDQIAPVYLRSWVGGDKDGHPGVTAETLTHSLTLSRQFILNYVELLLLEVIESLVLLPKNNLRNHSLLVHCYELLNLKTKLKTVQNEQEFSSAKPELSRTERRFFRFGSK